jgi:large subunit ribosomal protein L10
MSDDVASWKKEAVTRLATHLGGSKVIGIIDVKGVPAPAFQTMRANLRDSAQILMLKNSLLKRAIEKAAGEKKGIEKLVESVDGQCAVVTSDLNPFKLYMQLDATKTKMPAKGGEIAPDDIEIKAGDTPFKPGPIVGDLQKAGLPAAIEQGKVVIKRNKMLVKKGDEISRDVALVLSKLEIHPITVGLDLRAAYEDGMVFGKDVLAVDQDEYMSRLHSAVVGALNLSVFVAFPTRDSIRILLSKAHTDSLNLAVNAGVTNKETVKLMLAKAKAQMLSLAGMAPDALDDELKGAMGDSQKPDDGDGEQKKEEKKEEPKEEKVSEDEAAAGLGALFG